MIVKCPSCGQANNVPDLAAGQKAVCAKCKAPLPSPGEHDGRPATLTDANFATVVGSGKWLVDFWAEWCGPCRMMTPVLEELASTRRDVRIGKLNVDANQRTASQYQARSIPLFVFFRDGNEVGRVVGAVGKGGLEAAIARYLG